MTKYGCGCETDGIILVSNKNIFDLATLRIWSETVGVEGTREKCIYCFCKESNVRFGGSCKYKKGKWIR